MDQPETQNNFLLFKTVKNSDGSETVHYPAFYEGVPNEYKDFAEREFGETPEKVSEAINYLTSFMEEKGLSKIDEKYLLAVLRNCKYDLKKSKVKLEKFLRAMDLITKRVVELDFDRVDTVLRIAALTILPYRDKHGRLILMTKPVTPECYIDEEFVCCMALLLYALQFPMTSLFGITYIAESKTTSITLFYRIMKVYKTWIRSFFDLPFAVRKIDLTNENFVTRWTLNFVRPFISAKILSRISMHGDNLETLKKTFHPDILPEDFGGNLGPTNSEHYREKLIDFMRKLREEHLLNETFKS